MLTQKLLRMLACDSVLLNGNTITEFGGQKSVAHLAKLKRLELNDNAISVAHFRGLKALEALSLANNKLDCVPDFTDQEELLYLDLSGNRITCTSLSLSIRPKSPPHLPPLTDFRSLLRH